MKASVLQPTSDVLVELLKNDTLSRNHYLAHFLKMIWAAEGCYSIALDGRWGSGKTFFIKQSQLIIDLYNRNYDYDSNDTGQLKKIFEEYFGNNKPDLSDIIPVYYDAWENDDDTDPVLSILYEIVESVGGEKKLKSYDGIPNLLLSIVDAFAKTNTSGLLDKVTEENILNEIKKNRTKKEKINSFIKTISHESKSKLIVFIDELDRCNPNYAVKVLERVKHYYSNDSIQFVYSVNLSELQHTIKMHYGMDFDASKYLNRFFDTIVEIPPLDTKKYIDYLQKTYDGDSLMVHNHIVDLFGFQCRDIIRYFDILGFAIDNIPSNAFSNWFDQSNPQYFCVHYIIPIMIALKISDIDGYIRFVDGKESGILKEIMVKKDVKEYMMRCFFEKDDWDEDNPDNNEKLYYENIGKTYNAIFNYLDSNDHQNYNGSVRVGQYVFDNKVRKAIRDTIGLLSKSSSLNYVRSEGE